MGDQTQKAILLRLLLFAAGFMGKTTVASTSSEFGQCVYTWEYMVT